MMSSTYCDLINSANSITDLEKIDRWEKFQNKVLDLESITTPIKKEETNQLEKSNTYKEIGIGEFSKSIDLLTKKGITAKLIKNETTQQKYAAYELSFLGKFWKVRQMVDDSKNLKDAWMYQFSKAVWYQGRDKPDFDSINALCSEDNIDKTQSRLVAILGQPDDIVSRKDWRDNSIDDGYSLETTHIVGAAIWNFSDGTRLRFLFQNLHIYQNRTQPPNSFVISESCSINICLHPGKENNGCIKIDGLQL